MLDEEANKEIRQHYQTGNSIQAIARSYRVSVEEVLRIIDQEELATVELVGDQISPDEVGPNATFNPPQKQRATFSTD